MTYIGIDVHKRQSQIAVVDDDGSTQREIRVSNADLDEFAAEYEDAEAVIEATSNYYTVYDSLDQHLEVSVAHPTKLAWIAKSRQKTDEADASLAAFKNQAHSEEVCQLIADRLGRSTLSPDTPLSAVMADLWPAATDTALHDEEPVEPVPITHDASEHTLDRALQTALAEQEWQQVHATWPCLLLALTLRFAKPTDADEQAWEWLRSHTEDDLSPVPLREHLMMKLDTGASFGDFVEWYIDEYLITRATDVAVGKSSGSEATRGYFEQTGVGWRHVRDHTPGHWGARFDSAVSVLRDLALLDQDPATTDLTPDGAALLESVREGSVDAD